MVQHSLIWFGTTNSIMETLHDRSFTPFYSVSKAVQFILTEKLFSIFQSLVNFFLQKYTALLQDKLQLYHNNNTEWQ